jgi:hypothetical protein
MLVESGFLHKMLGKAYVRGDGCSHFLLLRRHRVRLEGSGVLEVGDE